MTIKSLQYLIRLGVFLTFLGHGVFALYTNPNWIKYLNTVGFDSETASKLMPVIGGIDILVAIVILLKPYKAFVIWAFIWAFSTALIRPLSGEPIWAFIERGSNWVLPLVLLIMLQKKNQKYN
ncbi:hypothetical protein VOI54_09080 [Tamlana sp. 2201CG12-4]|uniref:hypothetical protein n=1 Tax=Tamlana sp. 2201CG12-4 TaxID=3112582 RepID=UPI002DBAA84A|nr:hypothetical protein [Tamlana sp. 2201CG12-4]MEC3907173.1 hypothetical protein [Tamlana sp. 2201CG12-4]